MPPSRQPSNGQSSPARCPGTEPGEPGVLTPAAWTQGTETQLQVPTSLTWDKRPKPALLEPFRGQEFPNIWTGEVPSMSLVTWGLPGKGWVRKGQAPELEASHLP